MRNLTAIEVAVVNTLIADAESMIADLTQVLSPDEQAVREVRAARSWLRGIRDTGELSDDLCEECGLCIRCCTCALKRAGIYDTGEWKAER